MAAWTGNPTQAFCHFWQAWIRAPNHPHTITTRHFSFSMCTMEILISINTSTAWCWVLQSNDTPKRRSPVSVSKKWSNKYRLLILLEARAYILQFPDLGCSPGSVSWKWMPLTTCVVVAEHSLDQVLWSQSLQFQMSSEQDRKYNSVMMSAQQANLRSIIEHFL